jgi:hypothetical protein
MAARCDQRHRKGCHWYETFGGETNRSIDDVYVASSTGLLLKTVGLKICGYPQDTPPNTDC